MVEEKSPSRTSKIILMTKQWWLSLHPSRSVQWMRGLSSSLLTWMETTPQARILRFQFSSHGCAKNVGLCNVIEESAIPAKWHAGFGLFLRLFSYVTVSWILLILLAISSKKSQQLSLGIWCVLGPSFVQGYLPNVNVCNFLENLGVSDSIEISC